MIKSNKGQRFQPKAQDYPGKQGWSTCTWNKEQAVFFQPPLMGTECVGVEASGLWLLTGCDGPLPKGQGDPSKMDRSGHSISLSVTVNLLPKKPKQWQTNKKHNKTKPTNQTKKTPNPKPQPKKKKTNKKPTHNKKNQPNNQTNSKQKKKEGPTFGYKGGNADVQNNI